MLTIPSAPRSLAVALAITALFAPSANAGFVTTSVFGDDVTGIVVSTYVYVGRANTPTVLVYDPTSGALLQEVTLVTVAADTLPSGVISMAIASDSTILVGTKPIGEMFRISGLSATALGTFGSIDTLPVRAITAIHRVGNALYVGGEPGQSDTVAPILRTTSGNSLDGKRTLNFGADSRPFKVTAIGSLGDSIVVGTADTPLASGPGRLYLFSPDRETGFLIFEGDSTITAAVGANNTVLFSLSDSGEIRSIADTRVVVATPGETTIRAILQSEDSGGISVVFIGSDTAILRRLSGGLLQNVGEADSRLKSIVGLATLSSPFRLYGVGLRNGGSLLFYYDFTSPRVTGISIALDTALSEGAKPETFTTPISWGDYVITLTTDEKLKAVPTVTLTFSDGAQQAILMGGADTTFSANFPITSSRPAGTVNISIVAIDDAGNTGTVILSGASFIIKSFGSSAVASNLIRVPAGEKATIRYSLVATQNVSIRIYNMRGIEVANLSPGLKPAGQYSDVTWGGRNGYGEYVASGVYMIRIEAGSEIQKTHRVMLIR